MPRELLSKVDSAEKNDPLNQADLWEVTCSKHPEDAWFAVKEEAAKKLWPVHRWRGILNAQISFSIRKASQWHTVREICEYLLKMPNDDFIVLLRTVASWLGSLCDEDLESNHSDVLLALWDRTFDSYKDVDMDREELGLDIHFQSLNRPGGQLAAALISMQSRENFKDVLPFEATGNPLSKMSRWVRRLSMKKHVSRVGSRTDKRKSSGLSVTLRPRFDRLLTLVGTKRLLALDALARDLTWLNYVDAHWSAKVICEIDADTPEANSLLNAWVNYGKPQANPALFNSLRNRIEAGLIGNYFPTSTRERLAQLVTWAAIRKLSGDTVIEWSESSMRKMLTSAPVELLRSVARSLWTLKIENEKDATTQWQNIIKPFLHKIWPVDANTKCEEVSRELIRIPSICGSAFPEAAEKIASLIVPCRIDYVRYVINIDPENTAFFNKFATTIIELAEEAIDLSVRVPHDLEEILDDLVEANPDVRNQWQFRKLRGSLRGL